MTTVTHSGSEHSELFEKRGLLLSVRPRHASAILAGTKTVELRRKAPRDVDGATAILYASGSIRAVVGTVQIYAVENGAPDVVWERFKDDVGITRDEFDLYFTGANEAFALVLSRATAARYPMRLPDLREHKLEPPQSWRYLTRTIVHTLRVALGLDAEVPISQP